MVLSSAEKEKRKEERKRLKWKRDHKIINGTIHKWCSHKKHWVEMNDNNFYKNPKNSIDGYSPNCKKCDIERAGINQKNNKERAYEQHAKYRKTNKYLKWGRKHGEQQRLSGYNKRYYKNNPEKMKLYAQQHQNHDISSKEEKAMLNFFNDQCAYCGMTVNESKNKYGEKLHKEHVDDDGDNDLSNCIPACKGCNCSKYNNNMKEWYIKQDFYLEERYNKIIFWITEGYKDHIEEKPPYKITKQKVEKENGTYKFQFELWSVDKDRNMVELLDIKSKKKYLNLDLV